MDYFTVFENKAARLVELADKCRIQGNHELADFYSCRAIPFLCECAILLKICGDDNKNIRKNIKNFIEKSQNKDDFYFLSISEYADAVELAIENKYDESLEHLYKAEGYLIKSNVHDPLYNSWIYCEIAYCYKSKNLIDDALLFYKYGLIFLKASHFKMRHYSIIRKYLQFALISEALDSRPNREIDSLINELKAIAKDCYDNKRIALYLLFLAEVAILYKHKGILFENKDDIEHSKKTMASEFSTRTLTTDEILNSVILYGRGVEHSIAGDLNKIGYTTGNYIENFRQALDQFKHAEKMIKNKTIDDLILYTFINREIAYCNRNLAATESTRLFNWKDAVGKDKNKLLKYINENENLCVILEENAPIQKIDEKTIVIFSGIYSLSLKLNDEKKTVSLVVGDNKKVQELIVKNGLDVYEKTNYYVNAFKNLQELDWELNLYTRTFGLFYHFIAALQFENLRKFGKKDEESNLEIIFQKCKDRRINTVEKIKISDNEINEIGWELQSILDPVIANEKALKYMEEINDNFLTAVIHINLSQYYSWTGGFVRAKWELDKVKPVVEKLPKDFIKAHYYHASAYTTEKIGRYTEALSLYEKAIEFAERTANEKALCHIYVNIVPLLISEKQFNRAYGYIQKALSISKQDYESLSYLYKHLAELEILLYKNDEKAAETIEVANNYALKTNDKNLIAKVNATSSWIKLQKRILDVK